MFSPYYTWARRGGAQPDPNHYCCLNVSLYGPARRWTMTERGARWCARDATHFTIGPSALHWNGRYLSIRLHERAVPVPWPVRGEVRVHPTQLFNFSTPLEARGAHRWGPLAPSARVEVELQQPALHWQGQGYLDSNEGDEPITEGFEAWDWSRCQLRDGSSAVIYDTEPWRADGQVLALRFLPNGDIQPFAAPPQQRMRRTAWWIERRLRSDAPVTVQDQLEDTPFYQRAVVQSELLGERVTSFHETLYVPRLRSSVVQAMLPWRMPRRS